MKKAEFDNFADEYVVMHHRNIRASASSTEFFAEYKIKDMVEILGGGQSRRKILDFGGAISSSVLYVSRYFPNVVMICLDLSDRGLAIARKGYAQQAEFVSFEGRTLPFKASTFDLVFAA